MNILICDEKETLKLCVFVNKIGIPTKIGTIKYVNAPITVVQLILEILRLGY